MNIDTIHNIFTVIFGGTSLLFAKYSFENSKKCDLKIT